MALIRTDPITGTNGVDVNTWTRKVGSGTFKYGGSANLALMTPSSGSYSQSNWVSTTADPVDTDTYVDFVLFSLTEGYFTLSTRGPVANTGYTPLGLWLQIQPSQTSYQIGYTDASGNSTVLDYIYFVPTLGQLYTIRLRAVGTDLKCKVFPSGSEGGWDGSYTQSTVTSGSYAALSAINGSSGQSSIQWGNLRVYDAAGAPVVQNPSMSSMVAFGGMMPLGPTPDSVTMQSGVVNNNGHDWAPILDEDFTSKPNSSTVRTDYPGMAYYIGFSDTSGQGWYDPDQVLKTVNGVLTATLKTGVPSASAQAAGAPSTAKPLIACVMPDNYQDNIYGRASVRFRANQTTPGTGNQVGFKIVWFYFPNDNNWNEGEIDAFETDIRPGARSRAANAIPGTGVGSDGSTPADGAGNVYRMTFSPGYDLSVPTDPTAWHVATVEWAPEGIYIYWDGVLIQLIDNSTSANTANPWVPRNPMNFKLQMETVIGEGTVDPTAVATIEIDRVQTWELVGFDAGAFGYNGFGE